MSKHKRPCFCNQPDCSSCNLYHNMNQTIFSLKRKKDKAESDLRLMKKMYVHLLNLFRKKPIQLEDTGFEVPSRGNFDDMD